MFFEMVEDMDLKKNHTNQNSFPLIHEVHYVFHTGAWNVYNQKN